MQFFPVESLMGFDPCVFERNGFIIAAPSVIGFFKYRLSVHHISRDVGTGIGNSTVIKIPNV